MARWSYSCVMCLHIKLLHNHHYADLYLFEGIELLKCLQVILSQVVCVYDLVNSHNYLSCNIWGCAY